MLDTKRNCLNTVELLLQVTENCIRILQISRFKSRETEYFSQCSNRQKKNRPLDFEKPF